MQEQVNKRPLVDILAQATNREIAMRGKTYVYFDTKEEVSQEKIDKALMTQEELYQQDMLHIEIKKANDYLEDTDHKFLVGYKPKDGENIAEIEAKRDDYREFIRNNRVY